MGRTLKEYVDSRKRFALTDRNFLRTTAKAVGQDRAVAPAFIHREHGSLAFQTEMDELVSEMVARSLVAGQNGAPPEALDVREEREVVPWMAAGGRFLRPRRGQGGRGTGQLLLTRETSLTLIALGAMKITVRKIEG